MIGLQGEGDAKWVGVGGTSREMEYHLWVTLLFSIFCQLSGTDPREISMGAHSDAIKKQSIGQEKTDGIISESKDNGIRTFLSHIANSLNVPNKDGQNLFQELTGMDIEIDFIGLEIEDKKQKQEITKIKLDTELSINDILAENDVEKQTLDFGGQNIYDVKAIGNPSIMQALTAKNQEEIQKKQLEQQQAMQAGGEGGGEEGNGEEELTDEDKALLKKYGNSENVEIDETVKGNEGKGNEL